nr:MAG TPA: hypothetical protein [Caudoviricetes sp.]
MCQHFFIFMLNFFHTYDIVNFRREVYNVRFI